MMVVRSFCVSLALFFLAMPRAFSEEAAIGVNYYDCFARTLEDPADTSYREGFRTLAEFKVPFVRASFTGYYPKQMKLYLEDKVEYFRRMDGVVAAAEEHGVKLIPSFFWWYPCVPDIVGEPCNRWGDVTSKTHAFMRTYVTEVVARYKDSKAILAWEFGNELNLSIDLPNAAENRPPAYQDLGSPATRSAEDDLTSATLQVAYAAFAEAVRAVDPIRPLSTGNAIPRPFAYHQRTEGAWTVDTRQQFMDELLAQNPAPYNLISIHIYPGDVDNRFEPKRRATYIEVIAAAQEAAASAGKRLFIGEFGALPDDATGMTAEKTRAEGLAILDAVAQGNVPLAAIWVFDFAHQPKLTIRPDNERGFYLEALREANETRP